MAFIPAQYGLSAVTHKLFWQDPYLDRLETMVVSVNGPVITVDQTVFYAFSGGQESDSGTIAEFPVIEARKVENGIEYVLPGHHGLSVGERVMMTIDWPRRYRLMRLHFAAELVLELVYKMLGGVEKIGAHIAENKARIDFAWPESVAPLLADITARAHQIIDNDRPITSAFSDEANQRRYWGVEGVGRVPCGGTHLKSTGEVGRIKLKRKNIGGGKERIEIFLSEPQT